MTALPTIFPASPFANVSGTWTDEAGATTNLHLLIDEATAGDTDYIRTGLTGTVGKVDLGNTPADFITMNTLSVEARHSRGTVEGGTVSGNDTWDLWTYITDSTEAVQLAGGNATLANGERINTSAIGYVPKTQIQAYTYVNQTATKTQWDGAKMFIEAVFTAVSTTDSHRIWLDFIRLVNGDYDSSAGASVIPVPLTRRRPMRSLLPR